MDNTMPEGKGAETKESALGLGRMLQLERDISPNPVLPAEYEGTGS